MIDNQDSFTYNLVQYFRERGGNVVVYRNKARIGVIEEDIKDETPSLIVISPGPSTPQNSGISTEVVRKYAGKIPIFGVCLGMQVIAEAFGTKISRLEEIVHGGASPIHHDGKTIFDGLPQGFLAGRYHSLGAYTHQVKGPLEVSASTISSPKGRPEPDTHAFMTGEPMVLDHYSGERRIVMALRHKEYPIEGVQFHPESVLTMQYRIGEKMITKVASYLGRFTCGGW